MMNDYSRYSRSPLSAKAHAQYALKGRTHYVDSDTLKFFNATISKARTHCHRLPNGESCEPFFSIIERLPVGSWDAPKQYRFRVFDIYGTAISGCDDGFNTLKQAEKALYEFLDSIDYDAVIKESFEREINSLESQAETIRQEFKRSFATK